MMFFSDRIVKFQQPHKEETESLDMNAAIHGNWTLENAKAKLHQYMHMNEIEPSYKHSSVGPDHAKWESFNENN